MTQRDFIKSRLPFINAMAEGKTVELRCAPGGSWLSVRQGTEWSILHKDYEVRIQPTPEEERLAKYRALYEEWKRERFKVEYRLPFGDWFNESNPKEAFDGVLSGAYNLELRRKPAPSYTPWTFETAPISVRVRRKRDGRLAVAAFAPNCVVVYWGHTLCAGWDNAHITYADLLRDFEQLDGSACGEEAK